MHELGTSMAAIDNGITHTLMLKGHKDRELPLFSFSNIETATGHFAEANKLGQGGFGPVYKVRLDIVTIKDCFVLLCCTCNLSV